MTETVQVKLTGSAWGEHTEGLERGDIVTAKRYTVDDRYSHCDIEGGWYGYTDGRWAVEEVTEEDVVNHPSHYTSDPSGVECIQITRHRNFNIGNAIKYLWRNGLKDDPAQDAVAKQIEDLNKAIFYINDEIERLRGGDPE